MKKHKHKARGTVLAASMRLTPANHKHLHKEAERRGVSANFYLNDLLRRDAEKKRR